MGGSWVIKATIGTERCWVSLRWTDINQGAVKQGCIHALGIFGQVWLQVYSFLYGNLSRKLEEKTIKEHCSVIRWMGNVLYRHGTLLLKSWIYFWTSAFLKAMHQPLSTNAAIVSDLLACPFSARSTK